MVTVRAAREDDVPTLVALGQLMVAEAPWLSDEPVEPEVLFANLLGAVSGTSLLDMVVFVAEDAETGEIRGALVAMAAPVNLWSARVSAHEVALFVKPEHRRGGVAVSLVAAFESWASERGASKAFVGAGTGVEHAGMVTLLTYRGYAKILPETFCKHLKRVEVTA